MKLRIGDFNANAITMSLYENTSWICKNRTRM